MQTSKASKLVLLASSALVFLGGACDSSSVATRPSDGGDGQAGLGGGAGSVNPRCTTASRSVTVLASLEEKTYPLGLAVLGDTVFMGMINEDRPGGSLPTGALVVKSLSTAEVTTLALGSFVPSTMVAVPGSLFYIQGEITSLMGAWSIHYGELARFDLATRQAAVVDGDTTGWQPFVHSLMATPRGEVFWYRSVDLSGNSLIERWDEPTQSVKEVMGPTNASMIADQDHFYWIELTSTFYVDFLSMPIAGGVPSRIYQSAVPYPDALTDLVAVDDENLYYTMGGASSGIWAVSKTGGEGHVVVAGADPRVFDSRTIDDQYLYWVDRSEQDSLRRASKAGGGATEILWTADARKTIAQVVLDDCNIYWATTLPSQLFVRAR